jgi:predicted metal-binding protein
MTDIEDKERLERLVAFALKAGATKAVRLSPTDIRVEQKLAGFCREPKCPNYGLSMSCPPNVSGPSAFNKLIENSRHALLIRIEIDAASLTGDDRFLVFRLLHEVSAAVEIEAKRIGFVKANGFAGGSCKQSFCFDHDHCQVLSGQGTCRYPDQARPSMSGFGVNVGELMKSAGWSSQFFSQSDVDDGTEQLSWIAGLVLLG